MRVLALVQKFDPDDHILGCLHTWLMEISKQTDELYIVSLEKKPVESEKNIKTYSLGKECGFNKIRLLYNFNKIISGILLKRKVNLVFVLMCPDYVFPVAPYAKIMGIPIVMWYAHGNINFKLKIAHFLVDRVLSSSKDGFRLKSKKLTIVGQGIDLNRFNIQNPESKVWNNGKKIILSVGRISPIKNYEMLIKAANILVNHKNIKNIEFRIIGDIPFASQKEYFDFLKDKVKRLKLESYLKFIGPVTYRGIHDYYQNCDLFVSSSNTGSLDKVILEAMASGKITLTSNEAFSNYLRIYSRILLFEKDSPQSLAEKIIHILGMDAQERQSIGSDLREVVVKSHSLDAFTDKIITAFKNSLKG